MTPLTHKTETGADQLLKHNYFGRLAGLRRAGPDATLALCLGSGFNAEWLTALFAVQSQQPITLDPDPLTWVSGWKPLAILASAALP